MKNYQIISHIADPVTGKIDILAEGDTIKETLAEYAGKVAPTGIRINSAIEIGKAQAGLMLAIGPIKMPDNNKFVMANKSDFAGALPPILTHRLVNEAIAELRSEGAAGIAIQS